MPGERKGQDATSSVTHLPPRSLDTRTSARTTMGFETKLEGTDEIKFSGSFGNPVPAGLQQELSRSVGTAAEWIDVCVHLTTTTDSTVLLHQCGLSPVSCAMRSQFQRQNIQPGEGPGYGLCDTVSIYCCTCLRAPLSNHTDEESVVSMDVSRPFSPSSPC